MYSSHSMVSSGARQQAREQCTRADEAAKGFENLNLGMSFLCPFSSTSVEIRRNSLIVTDGMSERAFDAKKKKVTIKSDKRSLEPQCFSPCSPAATDYSTMVR